MNFPEWRHTRVLPCILTLLALLVSPLWFARPSSAQSEQEEPFPGLPEKYGTIDHRIPALFHQLQQNYGSATTLTANVKTTLFLVTESEEGKDIDEVIFYNQIKRAEMDTQVVYKRGPHDLRLRVLSDGTDGRFGTLLGPAGLHIIEMAKNKKVVNRWVKTLPPGRVERVLGTFVMAQAYSGASTLTPLLTNTLNNLSNEEIEYGAWTDAGEGKVLITIVAKFLGVPMGYTRYLIDPDKRILLQEEMVARGENPAELTRIVVDYSQVKLNGAVDDSLFSDSNLVRAVKQRSSRH